MIALNLHCQSCDLHFAVHLVVESPMMVAEFLWNCPHCGEPVWRSDDKPVPRFTDEELTLILSALRVKQRVDWDAWRGGEIEPGIPPEQPLIDRIDVYLNGPLRG